MNYKSQNYSVTIFIICELILKRTKTYQTREDFLKKIHGCVSIFFFKTVLYTHILNTNFFHLLKSFKHQRLFYLYLRQSSEEHTLSFQLHRLISAPALEPFL